MKSIPIKLSFAEEVKTFVNIVNRYPFDMDLRAAMRAALPSGRGWCRAQSPC